MAVPARASSRFFSAVRGWTGLGLLSSRARVCLIEDRIVTASLPTDEAVIFDTEDRRAYLLNHTAALVLGLTDGNRSVGEIARRIASDFGEDRRVVTRDVKRIYRDLFKKGVITMAHDRSYVPKIKKETVVREEDDGAFIFDPLTDELSAINDTGRIVLKHMNGKNTIAKIAKKVKVVFPDQEEEKIYRDVEVFIDELKSRGFLAE